MQLLHKINVLCWLQYFLLISFCAQCRFTELHEDSPEVATGHPRLPQWQARKSFQETSRAQGSGGVSGDSSESKQGSAAVTQPLLSTASKSSDAKDESPPSSPTQVEVRIVPGQRYVYHTIYTMKQGVLYCRPLPHCTRKAGGPGI